MLPNLYNLQDTIETKNSIPLTTFEGTYSTIKRASYFNNIISPLVLYANDQEYKNLLDSNEKESGIMEFYSLGMGDPLPISAYHNIGMTDLIEKCISIIPKFE